MEDYQALNKAKQQVVTNAMPFGSSLSGQLGISEACRPNLRERVAEQVNRAARESSKLQRMQELQALLEKHPDVARILDLYEEVR